MGREVGRAEIDVQKLANKLIDFEEVKDRIHICLRNIDTMPVGTPYLPFHEMAITFWVSFMEETFHVCVTEKMLSYWDKTVDSLYVKALRNTVRDFPLVCKGMEDLGFEGLEEVLGDDEPFIKILTNESGVDGATVILYDGALKEATEVMDSEQIVLIPSSVHEWLVISLNKMDELGINPREMSRIICEVNDTEVEENEVLFDKPLIYNGRTGKLKIYKEIDTEHD